MNATGNPTLEGARAARPDPARTGAEATTAAAPALDHPAVAGEVRRRVELRRLGGVNWGAAFLGWLVAVGIAVLLAALASAAGLAIGLSRFATGNPEADATALTVAGGAILTVILAIAYFAGGYAAGRMSRFAGAGQGLAVWAIGVVATAALALAGGIFGSQYNVNDTLRLPNLPVQGRVLSTGGAIALGVITALTLAAALLGGIAGLRYHRRVDRVARQRAQTAAP